MQGDGFTLTELLLIGVFGTGIIFLVRLILIFVGILKTPVMRVLQVYAEESKYYYPLAALIWWFGVCWTSGALLIMRVFGSGFPIFLPGIALGFLAAHLLLNPEKTPIPASGLQPRWYRELADRANRDEQRRIAYMWLRLPPRLRTFFELNDRAFSTWTDLIILSTGAQVSDEFVHNRNYRLVIARLKESLRT
jgi:hypothetical protein